MICPKCGSKLIRDSICCKCGTYIYPENFMKIKISTNGFLLIKRATEFKKQLCPRQKITGTGDIKCGDWCPLFGEPEDVVTHRKVKLQSLTLCHGTLTGFINDRRGEVEDEAT